MYQDVLWVLDSSKKKFWACLFSYASVGKETAGKGAIKKVRDLQELCLKGQPRRERHQKRIGGSQGSECIERKCS